MRADAHARARIIAPPPTRTFASDVYRLAVFLSSPQVSIKRMYRGVNLNGGPEQGEVPDPHWQTSNTTQLKLKKNTRWPSSMLVP